MAAYIIARIEVTDPEDYKTYATATIDIAATFGGRFLVKGGTMTQLEGTGPARHVVLEFPDRAAAESFYGSDAYRAVLPIALRASTRDLVIVDGA